MQNVPYNGRPPITETPCEKKLCIFGSTCTMDDKTNEANCKCLESCPSMFAPVCGSDGVSYANECQLRAASCSQQRRIRIKSQGSCDKKDPCANKICAFGGQCIVLPDGQNSRCQCPERCDNYGDSKGSSSVCGSNGKDYKNMCELRRAACQQMKDIQVKFYGKCDPCDGIMCSATQVCQLDDKRNPVCQCNSICTTTLKPVCGSDGKTYSNECTLRVEGCRARKSLRIIHEGTCTVGVNPCSEVQCQPGQQCHVDRYGYANCECPNACEKVMRPVCASDGKTYDNECDLRRSACLSQLEIGIIHTAVCGEQGPCRNHECNYGATCVVKNDQPTCECSSCTNEFKPVCGSDGISYGNACKLKFESCDNKKQIDIKYEGLCNGCENKECDFYAICENDGHEQARCICPESCIQVDAKVCGTDGATYLNECELKVAACKKQQFVMVASQGPCDLCLNVKCKYDAKCEAGKCVCPTACPDSHDPICGSDGVTYDNECKMRQTACKESLELDVLFKGECDDVSGSGTEAGSGMEVCDETTCRFGGLCEFDAEGMGRCLCNLNCKSELVPVCGSDGKTYVNECELRAEACRRQIRIGVQPVESCGAQVIKTCEDSQYGCCSDGKTPAKGPKDAGCPNLCKCNKLGSYQETCDPVTRQCSCKPGVGGLRCDRCEPGFWGLPGIADGNTGCIPCGCSTFGSVRDDCEQMTGRCVCKPGITGMKCNSCPDGKVLGPGGCSDADVSTPVPTKCSEKHCFFGARCEEREFGPPECICNATCPTETDAIVVCGTDGKTYGSECQLRLFACRLQKDIVIQSFGPCPETGTAAPTEEPLRKTTARRTTAREAYASKTTRHVLPFWETTEPTGMPPTTTSKPTRFFTIPPSTGRLAEPCRRDSDCRVPNSACPFGECECDEGFVASPDNKACTPMSSPVRPTLQLLYSACHSTPCLNGGTCVDVDEKGFHCICPLGRGGLVCSDEEIYNVVAFHGHSYLEFQGMKAYSQVNIEIEFRTFANDGILLYNGQYASGEGDFISLAIRSGFVEFRYNLGNGPAIVRTNHMVELGRFHRVLAKRFYQDGMLRLDEYDDVSGRSPGTLRALDLKENLFIGYIPTTEKANFDNVGVTMGLVGCIRSLKIDRKEYNLKDTKSPDFIRGVGIGECERNPCSSMPCQNGATCMKEAGAKFICMCRPGFTGELCEMTNNPCNSNPCRGGATCIAMPQEGFMCKCPEGRTGEDCQDLIPEKHDIYIPNFSGNSYLKLPALQNVGQAFSIEVWLLSRALNGLILYSGQLANGKGDFVSLNLVNGYLQFRFDLGSGIANITSSAPVTLGEWHSVKVTRVDRKGTMQINGGTIIKGESVAPRNELNLHTPLFIGGVKSNVKVNKEASITTWLNGAVQRVMVTGILYDNLLEQSLEKHGITRYVGPPCAHNPCLNGGICVPQLRNYECKCSMKYMGTMCEKSMNEVDMEKPVLFDANTALEYPNLITKLMEGQQENRFRVKFQTQEQNGMLLWQNKGSTIQGDYIAVAIVNGRVEMSYNLGKQTDFLVINSTIRVDDGRWHVVKADRKKRLGTLRVDDESPVTGISSPGATELNTDGILWIGGSPMLPSGLPAQYYIGFTGCIDEVSIEEQKLHLVHHGKNTVQFCF